MRSVIDSVLRNIYSEVVKARPDVKSEIGDYDKPKYLKLNLAMFPCYRSILNQITESCFSLPRVSVYTKYIDVILSSNLLCLISGYHFVQYYQHISATTKTRKNLLYVNSKSRYLSHFWFDRNIEYEMYTTLTYFHLRLKNSVTIKLRVPDINIVYGYWLQNPYVLDHLTVFANLCVVDNQIHQMVSSIVTKSCSNIPANIINVQ